MKYFAGNNWKADHISSTITQTFPQILQTMENLEQCNSQSRIIGRNNQIQIPWYPNFHKVCAHLYVFCLQQEMQKQIKSMKRTIKNKKKKLHELMDETLGEMSDEA